MNIDDGLYGARSGIQKAVRRGDLDLACTCFSALWAESKHKAWLKWRLAVIVNEDVWFMAGELAKLVVDAKGKPDAEQKVLYLRFVYSLCVVPKNKDADALIACVMNGSAPSGLFEAEILKEHYERLQGKLKDPAKEIDKLYLELLEKGRDLTDYEKRAMDFSKNRLAFGGRMGDQMMCLGTMALIAARGIDEAEVKAEILAGTKAWAMSVGNRKPRKVALPWYACDMHTVIGKIAMSMNRKKNWKNMTEEQMDNFWFLLESAFIPEGLRRTVKMEEAADPMSCFETCWWSWHARRDLVVQHEEYDSLPKVMEMWKKLRVDLHGAVTWLQKTRR